MGWTSWDNDRRPTDEIIRGELTWRKHDEATGDKHTIIASALVGTTWYGALEFVPATGDRTVIALVVLTSRRGGGFAYKDMTENGGPYETTCPARILDLLTPPQSENARLWREACDKYRATKRAAQVAKPVPGNRVVFNTPINYGGIALSDFIVVETPLRRRGLIGTPTEGKCAGFLYRLPVDKLADATIHR
jgi:hypothetical protein